jgi:hypothetical protein
MTSWSSNRYEAKRRIFLDLSRKYARAARAQGLEGIVAKRKDSRYEAGKRSGSWVKHRLRRSGTGAVGEFLLGELFQAAYACRSPLQSVKVGGRERARTPEPLLANKVGQTLTALSGVAYGQSAKFPQS